jgi:type VI secretion system ImpC/EvpB family protein/type VI secretion system ImpB/VipA family protein
MSKRWERSDVRLVSGINPADESSPLGEETPFMIGVIGDFTRRQVGGKTTGPVSMADCRPLEIDRDNFDAVMQRLDVRLDINSGRGGEEQSVELLMRGIESFHPVEIVKQVEPLRALLDLRRALENPAKFNAAAAEIQKRIKIPDAGLTPPQSNAPANLLEAILEEASPSVAPGPRENRSGDLERLIQEIASPHAIRLDVKQQQQLTAALDGVIGEQLRAILHHTDFQQLEAAWRSLYFLVMNAETGPGLKIYLLNVSKAELQTDLTNSRKIEDSGVFKSLSSFASESASKWGAFIGNFNFTMTPEDARLLDRIAQLAHKLRSPFIAGASSRFFGVDSFTSLPSARNLARLFEEEQYIAWRNFRKSPQARSVGLLLPRFLLRLPYGAKTDPVGSFSFEEGVRGQDHEKYMWGNPAFAFAVILAREFIGSGWSLNPVRLVGQLEGIPLHIYEDGGVAQAKPCAEALLSDEVIEALAHEGFMPLICHRDRDFFMIPRAQSVATPPAVLAGRW